MFKSNRIIDCILYNGEFDILKLRLALLNCYVDEFHITEAAFTFTGLKKHHFLSDKVISELGNYKNKIKYNLIQNAPALSDPWDLEFYLREQSLKSANAKDEDLIILSDVDELINLDYVLSKLNLNKINIIELECYYYFFNLKSNEKIQASIISKYSLIKNKKIGKRYNFCHEHEKEIIPSNNGQTGGHFTYQFGYDIYKYIQKIKSFSHQEYNNEKYLDHKRLEFLIKNEMDIFYRFKFKYRRVNLTKSFLMLKNLIDLDTESYAITRRFKAAVLINQFLHKGYRIQRYNQFKHNIKKFLNLIES